MASDGSDSEIIAYVEKICSTAVVNYCIVAMSAVVLYEQILTLSQEIHYIWGMRVTLASIIYYTNRYTLLISTVLNITITFPKGKNVMYCKAIPEAFEVCILLMSFLWAVFAALRVYVISSRGWFMTLLTLSLGLVSVGTNIFGYSKTFYGLTSNTITGLVCFEEVAFSSATSDKLVIATRVCLVASDLVVLSVIYISTYKLKRTGGMRSMRLDALIALMIRNGTFYFIIMLILNTLSIVLRLTDTFQFVTSTFITPISSLLLSRFLLDLGSIQYSPITPLESESEPHTDSDCSYPSQYCSSEIWFATTFVSGIGTQFTDELFTDDLDLPDQIALATVNIDRNI